MKIVGNIKDYYDGAATQFGYSDDVIFNRTSSQIVGTEEIEKISKRLLGLCKCSVTIGFCGKIYYGLENIGYGEGEKSRWLYPYFKKDVDTVLEIYNKEKERRGRKIWSFGKHLEEFSVSCGCIKLEIWQTQRGIGSGWLDSIEDHKIFEDLGCPIFSVEYTKYGTNPTLTKNPILRHLDFERFIDPYTAVQEIEMYLGRLATNNTPPMPVGSDKVIAESKGFDNFSFRKLPTKKK